MPTPQMQQEIKVVIIGDTGVGKTCIATRLISNTFSQQSPSTLSASFLRKNMNGKQLQIWDTAGQERFRSIAPLYYRNAFAVILVFDLTRALSFESLNFWLNDIEQKFANLQKPQIFFAGNKEDLQELREVSQGKIDQMAKEFNGRYFEVSALSGKNVTAMFEAIAQEFDKSQKASSDGRKKITVLSEDINGGRKGCCFQ